MIRGKRKSVGMLKGDGENEGCRVGGEVARKAQVGRRGERSKVTE